MLSFCRHQNQNKKFDDIDKNETNNDIENNTNKVIKRNRSKKKKPDSFKIILLLLFGLVLLIFSTLIFLGAFGFHNLDRSRGGDHDLESIILEGLPPRKKQKNNEKKEIDKRRIDFLHHHHQHHHTYQNISSIKRNKKPYQEK